MQILEIWWIEVVKCGYTINQSFSYVTQKNKLLMQLSILGKAATIVDIILKIMCLNVVWLLTPLMSFWFSIYMLITNACSVKRYTFSHFKA